LAIPLLAVGLLPANMITMNSLQIGSAVEMLILALALADHFNIIRKEKARAQKVALEAQQRLVENLQSSESILEERIEERTRALKESEERYRTLVEWTPEPLAVHRDGKVIYVNPAAINRIGAKSAQDLVGKPVLDWIHPDFHQFVLERAKNVAEFGIREPIFEEKFIKADGTVIDVEVQSTEIVFDGESAIQVALRDVTGRKAAADEIMSLAFYDALTGLPNRRLFRDRLQQELKKARRTGNSVALLFIDLDGFKEVNDRFGHAIGDLLLIESAQRIRACVREADTTARLGGDEFIVLVADLTDANDVERVAQAVVEVLAMPFRFGEATVAISGSVGVTLYPGDADDSDTLIRNADQAMYAAKQRGRARYRYFRTPSGGTREEPEDEPYRAAQRG